MPRQRRLAGEGPPYFHTGNLLAAGSDPGAVAGAAAGVPLRASPGASGVGAAAGALLAGLLCAACSFGAPQPGGQAAPAARTPVPAPQSVASAPPAAPLPTVAPSATPAPPTATPAPTATPINLPVPAGGGEDPSDQRTIAGLRARAYEGGPVELLRTLGQTGAYTSYAIAYPSDGLRVTGFLNVPRGDGPFPVVIVNHGYVPPAGYVAVSSNYAKREGDFLAAHGYLTAGPDFRGHGNNPGTAVGTHLEPAYVVDALNLLASLRTVPQADLTRVGVWGHSNGGSISERMMVVSRDVDATVIWAGVSADAVDSWLYLRDWLRFPADQMRRWPHPDEQPHLYARMGARAYLADVAGPVQIHHGTADAQVPYQHAVTLAQALAAAGKPHELHTYTGAPHNWVGPTWDLAISRTLAFYDQLLRRQ